MTTATTEMVEVSLDQITPNPWQPRASMEPGYIGDLAASIAAVGLLQEPLARRHDGYFQLAFGHSRIEAIRFLQGNGQWGSSVRLKVQDLTDEQMAYIALRENMDRKNLTPAEEIRAWAKILNEIEGVTVQRLADEAGVDRTTMSKNLAILHLPDSVVNLVDSGAMSVRSARELLALRNDDHCHEDMIALVLQDLKGGYSAYNMESNKAPDYRLKTVRASIRGLTRGRPAYGYAQGMYEADRKWRPLCGPGEGGHTRTVSFDVAAFKKQYPHSVHVIPVGDESGGAEWTCETKAWATCSSRASREATMAAKASGQPTPAQQRESGGPANLADQWWKVVKRDPLVKEVVGGRLRAMKSAAELTDEDRKALGSRVEFPNTNNAIELPQVAQPKEVELRYDRGMTPPLFDFSRCANCTKGAAWVPADYHSPTGRLVCVDRQAWEDKKSVGMQQWTDLKDVQVEKDRVADQEAVGRLSKLSPWDSRALFYSMFEWLQEGCRVRPLMDVKDWSERTRHDYWPAGAEMFASLTGLTLPEPAGWDYNRKSAWETALERWLQKAPDDFDWSLALGCVLAWRARVAQGLGTDIWGGVAAATVD